MRTCDTSSNFNGLGMNARIVSVFVLLAVSAFGSFFPLLANKWRFIRLPSRVLALIKQFGTGVILATAYIHLLGEAQTSLTSPCLGGVWEDYSWSSAICLMGTFTMFSIEIFVQHLVSRKHRKALAKEDRTENDLHVYFDNDSKEEYQVQQRSRSVGSGALARAVSQVPSVPSIAQASIVHGSLGVEEESKRDESKKGEEALKKLTSLFLLEFGIVFHSVFVGLSLAIAGEEFNTLFVAISFHQFFEGIGLASRFATTSWPPNMRMVPWIFSTLYSLTTPVGIAVGLGVRHFYLDNSTGTLIVVGVFDSFCAGLLIYNCLVELMAPDFLVEMQHSSGKTLVTSYMLLVTGTAVMALIGKWA